MTRLIALFREYFAGIHGVAPFPWQERLVKWIAEEGWPATIGLPTATGKTAVIDVAVFALAMGMAGGRRRVFFIVDRRVVVDEAAERAARIADCLSEALDRNRSGAVAEVAKRLHGLAAEAGAIPLEVSTLRGGIPRDDTWTRSPLQPIVCCTTVDQVGSSLLFRAYGSRSSHDWPIRAGLAGRDALYVLDEAHLSGAFAETVRRIAAQYGRWGECEVGNGIELVELTATGSAGAEFELGEEDRVHPVLAARIGASKITKLVEVSDEVVIADRLAEEAENLASRGSRVTGIVVNRVATAREVFERLRAKRQDGVLLLTGRMRPMERDRLWSEWRRRVEAGRAEEPAEPIWVVATQCIEVGANIDFTGLVTEAAPLDSLIQRFGRLDRLGRLGATQGSVLFQKGRHDKDAVYGDAVKAAWKWLKERAIKPKKRDSQQKWPTFDFGVAGLASHGEPPFETLTARRSGPVLLPVHLDLLAQTCPPPEPAPEVSLFLHGPSSSPADVRVIWRGDLDGVVESAWSAVVEAAPPTAAEAMSLPVWTVRNWLMGRDTTADLTDLEGGQAERDGAGTSRKVLVWRGSGESTIAGAEELRPGDQIILPAAYGGCDRYGWNPASRSLVTDLGSIASLRARGRAMLRLTDVDLGRLDEDRDIHADLVRWQSESGHSAEIRLLARLLSKSRDLELIQHPEDADQENPRLLGVISRRRWLKKRNRREDDFEQETQRSSWTGEIGLEAHGVRVGEQAARYAEKAGADEQLLRTITTAARWHDIGKLDSRFQSWLRGGRAVLDGEAPLAKSGRNGLNPTAIRMAREASGYPEGGRHELLSVALLAKAEFTAELDGDLLLHLVGSHHGRCRPFAPFVDDNADMAVEAEIDGQHVRSSVQHELHRLGSGVAERYWRLIQRYGWWGLAWMEAIVRIADQRVSEEEQG